MATLPPDTFCIEPPGPAEAAVIGLHGLGADGRDLASLVPLLGAPQGTRFLFPDAPHRPITINGGHVMRGWYDLRPDPDDEDAEGLTEASWRVRAMIEAQAGAGIPEHRIVLAGFSQGGALALHTALRLTPAIGGVLALSTYLPLADQPICPPGRAGAGPRILMMHGTQDDIIPLAFARRSARSIREEGLALQWHETTAGHAIDPTAAPVLSAWLQGVLAGAPPG